MDINNKLKLFLFSVTLLILLPVILVAHHANCQDVHAAAYLDEPFELAMLFSHGADQNCRDEFDQTPLITATNGASLRSMKMLLKQGVNVNSRDEIGETALTKALQKKTFFDMKGGKNYHQIYQKIINLLVQAGATE
jgi:ankyrin repeat protein